MSKQGLRRRSRALVAMLVLAGCGGAAAHEPVGYTLDPAPEVGHIELPDAAASGQPMRLRAQPDGILLTFFGYTNCPDVCPLTMSDIRTALGNIGDRAERVDVAMVTIDPARDTGAALADYVASFVPHGHALRTDDDTQLRAAATAFGASYAVTNEPDGSVAVSHTGSVFAVDDTGAVRLVWTFGTAPADLTADLEWLLDRASS